MTTEEMKYHVCWHFHYRMKYPLVTCECVIGHYNLGDVVAVRNTIIAEVEIKQKMSEIFEDLKEKWDKHQIYLQWNDERINSEYFQQGTYTRPNKFYFAIPEKEARTKSYEIPTSFPPEYGLITINEEGCCGILKRAKYLTRDQSQVEKIREMVAKSLTAQNLNLRKKILNV